MEYNFTEKIKEVKKLSAGVPKKLTIDLADVATDRAYDIAGNVFYVLSAPNEYDRIDIKINETREPAISYVPGLGLETPFYRLYITTPAGQTGDMIIIYGTEAPDLLRIIDHRSSIIAAATGILAEMRGNLTAAGCFYNEINVHIVADCPLVANANRKACMVQATSTNTGIVYLGFDNLVTNDHWFAELLPGMAFSIDDYRGPIWSCASINNQRAGYGEW